MKLLRKVSPLYVASFLFGVTAAIVAVARHSSGPPPSPSFVDTVHKMGFESTDEFTDYARLTDDPKKTSLSTNETEFLKRLLRRGNDASWGAVNLLGRLKDEKERDTFLPDVRSIAAHDPTDSRLKTMMDGWKDQSGTAYIANLTKDKNDPLATAAVAVMGEKSDAAH